MSVYLDHHAASPVEPEVLAAMDAARPRAWANPSSAHAAGRAARRVVEEAREALARAIGGLPADVVFTSGGTEACNLGVLGLARGAGGRVVTTALEHPAVAEAVRALGLEVVRVDAPGGVAPADLPLEGAALACVQWVNHETGSVLPVEAWARRCRELGVPLFVDACQALGKLPVDVGALGASVVALASSKIGGPPGAGALWIARGTEVTPRALGGGQERGRRAGSPDPVALAGFGAAAGRVEARLAAMPAVAVRRDRLEAALAEHGPVAGAGGPRVATVTNVAVRGWSGARLVAALDVEGVMTSHGAACSSGVDAPSAVLRAMYPEEPWRADSAVRLSLGPATTDADVEVAIAALEAVLGRQRTSSGF
ncbi:MAG: aminotransferase class V-fold PLP-dependent enzyme [Sandaracinaceae bacterium]|nr:aminotransferase class V-fold PLP-dependent enzyme [Sandaracinaceae bacterium]